MIHKGMMIGTQNTLIHKIGFWAAVVAFIGAVGYIVSVPLQIFNVLNYVQDSIIAFGFSLIIPAPFLVAMLALPSTVSAEKKFWTHAAVVFAVIYTTYCTLNYVVQLTTVPTGYATSESRGEKALKNEQKQQKCGYLRENSLFADVGRSGSKGSPMGQSHPVGEGSGLENPL